LADDYLRYVQQFESYEQASSNARAESEQARDYFDGKQFTAEQMAVLKKRKQPITPENLIKPKIEGLCGLERQGRTDPKAYPRSQSKEADANAATDALRYVSDDQDIGIKKSRVFENMLIEGFGGVEVSVGRVKGQIDPKIIHICWDRLYADPHSAAHDYSDASFNGYVTWMDVDTAKRKWPDAKDIIDATMSRGASSSFDSYDDKPKWAYWSDPKRKRVRINTHYHMVDGVWHRCVFTLAGELEESKPSVFIDEDGNPENPLIMESAYIDRDNDRYGIVRDMIPLQDEVNKRRSKFLHMVSTSKVRVSPGVAMDAETIRREWARPDGVFVGEQGEVEELGNLNREAGQFQLLADTRQTLKGNIGPNATMQGKTESNQSGRALLALQQAGMTEMTPLLDNLRHFNLRLFRQIWNRIRQFWTAERWIRVTDDENNIRFVGLNVTQGHVAMQKLGDAVKEGKLPIEQARQYEQQIVMDPAMQQPANHVAELDVDVEIDEVNETPSLQAEQFEQLVQFIPMFGQPPPPEIVELVIAASSFRDKQRLMDIVEKMKEAAQQPNPMQEIQVKGAQAEVAGKEADVGVKQATAALTAAKAQNEQIKPIIEGHKAGMQAPAQ
jgi:hypothetical protein